VHLCESCAKNYLLQNDGGQPLPAPTIGSMLAKQLKLGQAAEELAKLDQRACPKCGITFYEFRNQGRLGCSHDYTFFERELTPLILNIHGEAKHVGKRPRAAASSTDEETELIRLRREMEQSIKKEEYEQASQIRDKIRQIEQQAKKK
jgi:protein arginine kinase activator